MREDDDHIRLYTPVLQRIVILMAVIAAVPVVLWGISNFVRSYVAPPKAPTFQRLAVAQGPDSAAATQEPSLPPPAAAVQPAKAPDPAPAVVEAKTVALVAVKKPPALDRPQDAAAVPQAPATQIAMATSAMPAPAAPTAAAPNAPQPVAAAPAAPPVTPAADAPAASGQTIAWPEPPKATMPANDTTVAAQEPSAAADPDALPAADPLTGRVPLPRQRPRVFAMAQLGMIPMPRPRPEAAGPGTPETKEQPSAASRDFTAE